VVSIIHEGKGPGFFAYKVKRYNRGDNNENHSS